MEEKSRRVNKKIEKINREKEKISRSARSETRRIIAERCETADEILKEIENIFKAEEISQSDLIKARTLKNKLSDISYEEEEIKNKISGFIPANRANLKCGATVFIEKTQSRGQVIFISNKKDEIEVLCGSIKMHCKFADLQIISGYEQKKEKTKVIKHMPPSRPLLEINVLGMTVEEALYEVDNFIDRAVTDNLEEIKVIHGVGTGRLKNAIAQHLKGKKNVESFRLGKYGEGETGVTVSKVEITK